MKPTIREILQGRWQATNVQGHTQNFDSHDEAQAFSTTGTMILYKGFEIHPTTFEIFRNNKAVAGSYWRNNVSVEAAKITIDASLVERSLASHPALVLHEIQDDRFSRWMENEAAKELHEREF